jgi:hypothetical protein
LSPQRRAIHQSETDVSEESFRSLSIEAKQDFNSTRAFSSKTTRNSDIFAIQIGELLANAGG